MKKNKKMVIIPIILVILLVVGNQIVKEMKKRNIATVETNQPIERPNVAIIKENDFNEGYKDYDIGDIDEDQ